MKFGVGQSVPRKEDPRLITGGGKFTDDVNLPGQLYLAIFRSPYAHGEITRLDVEAAKAMPGVVAVYTSADLAELGSLPCRAQLKNPDGSAAFIPARTVLATAKVAFVGQAVAAIVGESCEVARLAGESIELQVRDLAANVDPGLALSPDTTVIHEDHGSNMCVHYVNGDVPGVQQAIEQSAHTITVELVNNRVAPSPLEPRACVASFGSDGYTLYNPSQGPFAQQGVLANAVFKVPMEEVRVISLDTGGGFGIRGEIHPEPVICLFAAKALGRPVKYSGDRSEMFLADSHGRDNLTKVTGGFDDEGRVQALLVETIANLGAYCTAVGPFVPTMAGGRVVGTVYKIPQVAHSVRPVFTNTMPVAAYRGAGRPEACYVMERLLQQAAKDLNLDAIAIRHRNFVAPGDFPYAMPSGVDLTCGEFSQTLNKGLQVADWEGFEARKSQALERGKLRGRGVGFYVESSGGGPEEEAQVTINPDGTVDAVVGTFSHGQGHRTTFSQVLADHLGINFESINIVQGDTREVKFGGGTGGSRSSQMGSIAVMQTADVVLADAQQIAAEFLQVEPSSLRYESGQFSSPENSATATLAQVATAAQDPQFGARKLVATHRYNRGGGFTFPNGCHVAEVEVDAETGVVEVVSYAAVDDCGRVINPLLAAGQVHGGVVQGIGQAVFEQAVYDSDGQLITGSLMDYTMPRASQVPDINVQFNEVLDPNNVLGVKGIGEGGACGAPCAVVNATIDALAHLGVSTLDMPLTSEKVWRAMLRCML